MKPIRIYILLIMGLFTAPCVTHSADWLKKSCAWILTKSSQTLVLETTTGPVVIRGRPYLISPFYLDTTPGIDTFLSKKGKYQATTIRPDDGRGRVIVIAKIRQYSNYIPILWNAALAYPKYFSQFEIYANQDFLVIPDSERMDSNPAIAAKFLDVPIYQRQFYTEKYFSEILMKTQRVPLASRDHVSSRLPSADWDGFFHDRLDQHLLGALLMPDWMFRKYLAFSAIIVQWREQLPPEPLAVINHFYRELTPGAVWDNLTANIGREFSHMIARKLSPTQMHDEIERIFKTADQIISIHSINSEISQLTFRRNPMLNPLIEKLSTLREQPELQAAPDELLTRSAQELAAQLQP